MEPISIVTAKVEELMRALVAHLPQLALSVLALAVTWGLVQIVTYLIGRVLGGGRLRRSLVEVFQKLASIGLWVFGILVAATILFPTLTPGKILAAVGLGSIAIGFAFKDIFENFLAGVLILFREPFRLGDYIECNDYEGFVDEITIRDTHIRRTDGVRVVLPNAMLFKNAVRVMTDSDLRRTTITCGVAYGEDVDDAREVIRQAVEGQDGVDTGKDVQIFAKAFGASSIDFEVTWWTGSKPVDIRRSRDKVVAGVKRALDEAGIEIPFPYRTLTFKQPLTVASQDAKRDREAANSEADEQRSAG